MRGNRRAADDHGHDPPTGGGRLEEGVGVLHMPEGFTQLHRVQLPLHQRGAELGILTGEGGHTRECQEYGRAGSQDGERKSDEGARGVPERFMEHQQGADQQNSHDRRAGRTAHDRLQATGLRQRDDPTAYRL